MVIAAVLFTWLVVTDTFSPLAELSVSQGSFVERLIVGNAGLVLFNLLPFAGILVHAGKRWSIKAGYRLLEGSADNDEVYTFALVHCVAAGVVVRF